MCNSDLTFGCQKAKRQEKGETDKRDTPSNRRTAASQPGTRERAQLTPNKRARKDSTEQQSNTDPF